MVDIGGGELDLDYLTGLSDDVVPELAAGVDELPPAEAKRLRGALCRMSRSGEGGVFAINMSRHAPPRRSTDSARPAAESVQGQGRTCPV